ncbi:MAG: hypothetical protein VW879_01905 [Opitutae bacterium]
MSTEIKIHMTRGGRGALIDREAFLRFLEDVRSEIEEGVLYREWGRGDCRWLPQIIKDGDMPWSYDETVEMISQLTQENTEEDRPEVRS